MPTAFFQIHPPAYFRRHHCLLADAVMRHIATHSKITSLQIVTGRDKSLFASLLMFLIKMRQNPIAQHMIL